MKFLKRVGMYISRPYVSLYELLMVVPIMLLLERMYSSESRGITEFLSILAILLLIVFVDLKLIVYKDSYVKECKKISNVRFLERK